MEVYSYKGISAGKYIEGEIEALNQDEASHKLKEQKVIITNLLRSKKKKGKKEKSKDGGLGFLFGGPFGAILGTMTGDFFDKATLATGRPVSKIGRASCRERV